MINDRVLVASFTKLIFALRKDEISTRDFSRALFFFGCTRAHVMDPLPSKEEYVAAQQAAKGYGMPMHEWFTWDRESHYNKTLQYALALRKAVPKAEEEGRMIWRERGEMDKWSMLFDMVARFGIRLDLEDIGHEGYCYPKVIEILSPHIRVIG